MAFNYIVEAGIEVAIPHSTLEVQQPGREDEGRHAFVGPARKYGNQSYVNEQAEGPGMIVLRKRIFWASVGIVSVLLLGIAVGLGVGLTRLNKEKGSPKKKGTAASSLTASSAVFLTISLLPSAINYSTPSAGPLTAFTTPISSIASSGQNSINTITITTTVEVATTTVTPSTDCPQSNSTLVTKQGLSYTKLCNSNFEAQKFKLNLANVVLYTFNTCIGLCASMNSWQGNTNMTGAVYNWAGLGEQTPGNCWCVSAVDYALNREDGTGIAVLVGSS